MSNETEELRQGLRYLLQQARLSDLPETNAARQHAERLVGESVSAVGALVWIVSWGQANSITRHVRQCRAVYACSSKAETRARSLRAMPLCSDVSVVGSALN